MGPAPSTALATNGTAAATRPASSATMPAATKPRPDPPTDSGSQMPSNPADGELAPELGVEAVVGGLDLFQPLGRGEIGEDPGRQLPDGLLLLGEGEVHVVSLS